VLLSHPMTRATSTTARTAVADMMIEHTRGLPGNIPSSRKILSIVGFFVSHICRRFVAPANLKKILVTLYEFKMKIVFLQAGLEVPPAIKQYKNRGSASNLVQSHFGSPQLKRIESGIAPLAPRGFDPAYWGLIQLPLSGGR